MQCLRRRVVDDRLDERARRMQRTRIASRATGKFWAQNRLPGWRVLLARLALCLQCKRFLLDAGDLLEVHSQAHRRCWAVRGLRQAPNCDSSCRVKHSASCIWSPLSPAARCHAAHVQPLELGKTEQEEPDAAGLQADTTAGLLPTNFFSENTLQALLAWQEGVNETCSSSNWSAHHATASWKRVGMCIKSSTQSSSGSCLPLAPAGLPSPLQLTDECHPGIAPFRPSLCFSLPLLAVCRTFQ